MLARDSQLGSYRLIERIGAGGMGEVWKAEDIRLGRTVAIKILPAAVASDADAMARMRREARTAAQLYHPNIATIHSFEQDGDHLFIVMELVEGQPLSAVLARGPMNEAEICRVGRGVAEALVEAHAKGIIHRDIKPDNVIVAGNRVKVLDFGIAKQMGAAPGAPSPNTPATFMTQQGMIIGTIQYMSPEQALGKPLDARSDIFSLGVMLYEAATGRLPFKGETVTDTMTQIIRDEPENPQVVNPRLSNGLAGIIRRSMAKKREDRYASAEEISAALETQLGRASTAPFTAAGDAPTEVRTPPPRPASAAAPTVVTGAKPVAVQPPKSRIGAGRIALIAALTAGIAAAVVLNSRSSGPASSPAPITQPAKPVAAPPPAAPQPTSTASLNVAAPANPVIVEQTTSPAAPAVHSIVPPPPTTTHAPPSAAPAQVVPEPQPPVAASEQPSPSSANEELYRSALMHMRQGDSKEARKELHRILETDQHNAKAHFRMGEIAMMNRNFEPARGEYELALADADRLNPHELTFTRLGVAITMHNRPEVQRIAAEINARWPDDSELQHIEPAFPGMFDTPFQRQEERPRRFRRH